MTHLSAAPATGCKPFVQMSSRSGPHERHPVERLVEALQSQPSGSDPQLCLLVQPVGCPREVCGVDDPLCSTSAIAAQSEAQVLVHGSAGSCCDEAPAGHPEPDHHDDPAHHTAQAAASRLADIPDPALDRALASQHGLEVRYYGLVSQSRDAQADGCYLIKMVQQSDRSACRCMHYSLMRVSHGSPLAEQARQYWQC